MLSVRVSRRTLSASFVAALLLVGVVGCGGGPEGIPISGKVMIGAEPANTGSVAFHPDGAKGNKDTNLYGGSIDPQGQYSINNSAGKPGAPAGWYKVIVECSVPSDPKDPYSLPKSLIDKKFNDVGSTPLSVEVKKDAPPGTYDLKVTK